MRKRFLAILCIILTMLSSCTFGATREDIISAMKETYTVGEDTFKLPNNIVKKAEKYFKKNELTEEQYSNILNNINRLVGIAQKNGTIDVNQMSAQDKMKAFDIIADTSKTANIDLDKALEENNIVIEIPVSKPAEDKKDETEPVVKEEIKEVEASSNKDNVEKNSETSSDSNSETTKTLNLSEMIRGSEESTTDNSSNNDGSEKKSIAKEVNKKFNRYATLVVVGAVIILFINFLIIYLIFKTKWNRMIKYILIVIFVLIVLVILAALIYGLFRLEDIRAVYKLYYIFK